MCNDKLAIVLFVVGVVQAYNNNDLRTIDSITNESPCLSQGGICTISADCPRGLLTEQRGLCPAQRSRGVECCYGISVKETRCAKRGGDCAEGCNERFVDHHATDCPKNTACCIYVN